MAAPSIQSFKRIIPMIYAYNTPGVIYHAGWTKIGFTAKQTVEDRIHQQTGTADIIWELAWKHNALYQDGSMQAFDDKDFHEYLELYKKIERKCDEDGKREWFHIDGDTSKKYFDEFAAKDWKRAEEPVKATYDLRAEQVQAVQKTKEYFEHGGTEFLWNAKPRFGKSLSTYDLIRQMKLKKVLIVTNRPSVSNSWRDDFVKFINWRDEYCFVSENDALKKKEGVMTRLQYSGYRTANVGKINPGMIVFESLQSLKGSIYFGGEYDKLEWLSKTEFDLLVVDESHEGVDTRKTDYAFDNLKRKYTLYLSGTPFKALAKGDFSEKQIYNWSYVDEQNAKLMWKTSDIYIDENGNPIDDKVARPTEGRNPYERMPKLNLLTYQLSAMIREQLQKGARISEDETVDYAFDLNEFFKTKTNGEFVYEKDIKKFLEVIKTNEKYPFSTQELRNELRHTLWLLNRVESARALAKFLQKDPLFSEYEVVLAAGDGKLEDDEVSEKAYDKVKKAIAEHDRTITLSVGQLTQGITIPEWTGVLMLCNMDRPAKYIQAIFRAQNPYQREYFDEEKKCYIVERKENAYVFDFDPARTLIVYEQFANDLRRDTTNGHGTREERENNIRELLNFFPVLGEDDEGRMIELDAAKVLSMPRKIKCQEVVRNGFMSNYLFQNIANVFGAPGVVRDIVGRLTPAFDDKKGQTTKKGESDPVQNIENVPVNREGEVEIPDEIVIGTETDIFGDKKFGTPEDVARALDDIKTSEPADQTPDSAKELVKKAKEETTSIGETIKQYIHETVTKPAVNATQTPSKESNIIQKEMNQKVDAVIEKAQAELDRETAIATAELNKTMQEAQTEEDIDSATEKYKNSIQSAMDNLHKTISNGIVDITTKAPHDVVERIEHNKAEKEKSEIEESVRTHLRGFSRTIPSFIMAYGDDDLTLANFDQYTEPDVFKEVTGITLDDFRFLRDGGDYRDEATGQSEHFAGHLFDEVVFNDSIQEFLNKKKALANYFDESHEEDIFDYIPPQKTNQIFTPKWVVKKMIDELETEEPDCFDDPTKTFADLYMKLGLYITEIVKRLYNSEAIKRVYPEDSERIRHIIEYQVYGMAPTRIIYLIATNYILGFDEKLKLTTTHFVEADASEAAKNGRLQSLVDQHFGK